MQELAAAISLKEPFEQLTLGEVEIIRRTLCKIFESRHRGAYMYDGTSNGNLHQMKLSVNERHLESREMSILAAFTPGLHLSHLEGPQPRFTLMHYGPSTGRLRLVYPLDNPTTESTPAQRSREICVWWLQGLASGQAKRTPPIEWTLFLLVMSPASLWRVVWGTRRS